MACLGVVRSFMWLDKVRWEKVGMIIGKIYWSKIVKDFKCYVREFEFDFIG